MAAWFINAAYWIHRHFQLGRSLGLRLQSNRLRCPGHPRPRAPPRLHRHQPGESGDLCPGPYRDNYGYGFINIFILFIFAHVRPEHIPP
ncbi:MAG: hypothetical protein N3B16_06180 [Candidatus Aminicenantes bacterium]|nr:hypothetical protein [Candidatus Aminicenantes bacterium]